MYYIDFFLSVEMHPLSHAYRPGVMGPIPPGYHMHPGYHPHPHPHLAVRLDHHTGMPYMEWAVSVHA